MNVEAFMGTEIQFKKSKILTGVFFCIALLVLSISFLLIPDIYVRNVFTTAAHIQIIGIISTFYFLTLLFSLVKVFPRKYAILITDEYLVDHSKYESIGKIRWGDITKVQRLKKRNIQVYLNTADLPIEKDNLLKKFLRFMHNWNYKKSILISSALLDCGIDELFKTISERHKNIKRIQH